jgi:hypothetical protein
MRKHLLEQLLEHLALNTARLLSDSAERAVYLRLNRPQRSVPAVGNFLRRLRTCTHSKDGDSRPLQE